MWIAITTSVLKIIEYFLSIWSNKSKNTELTTNEKARKLKKEEDIMNDLTQRALKGDKKALEEIRKRIS